MRTIIRSIINCAEYTKGPLNIRNVIAKEDKTRMSVSIIEINGENTKTNNSRSDTIYYILEGNGVFEIDGEKSEVNSGDCVYIPKGSVYKDKGVMRMLSICTPPYDPDTVRN